MRPPSPWLRITGRAWVPYLEVASLVLMGAAFVVGVAGHWVGLAESKGTAVLVLLAASFGLTMAHYFLLFNGLRCPACGFNPTKFKNGNNMPMNRAYKLLNTLERCPACGA